MYIHPLARGVLQKIVNMRSLTLSDFDYIVLSIYVLACVFDCRSFNVSPYHLENANFMFSDNL